MRYLILLLLTGCTNFNASETIAGGAEGKVDYCIKFMGTEILCVNANRTLKEKVDET